MIAHLALGITSFIRAKTLRHFIDAGEIAFAGNKKLKIYGKLSCCQGKRMNAKNRVFFKSAIEAQQLGYRPCGHCMRKAYQEWKLKEQ